MNVRRVSNSFIGSYSSRSVKSRPGSLSVSSFVVVDDQRDYRLHGICRRTGVGLWDALVVVWTADGVWVQSCIRSVGSSNVPERFCDLGGGSIVWCSIWRRANEQISEAPVELTQNKQQRKNTEELKCMFMWNRKSGTQIKWSEHCRNISALTHEHMQLNVPSEDCKPFQHQCM